jgi:hypothetical protein
MATDISTREPDCPPPGEQPPQDDCGCGSSGTSDCDPELLDTLKCRVEGVAAQAAYDAAAKADLDAARDAYPQVRTDYRAARANAVQEVADLKERVHQELEKARCQIANDDVVTCLDDAFACVVKKLKKCGGSSGCCSTGDCEFDTTCLDTLEAVSTRLAEYVVRLEAEKGCFDRLKGEPTALTQRVADIKTKIDNAWKPTGATTTPGDAAAGDGGTGSEENPADLHRVYATLLVAQRQLQKVWNGFRCTQDYLDCLCHALTCWIKATEAVSILTGQQAVLLCQAREQQARCDELATNPEDETLLEYERLCGEDSDSPDEPDDGCDDEPSEPWPGDAPEEPDEDPDEDPDDCGCGNEHHHRKGSKKKGSKKKR